MTHKSYRFSSTMARMLIVAACVLALASSSWGAGKPAPNFTLKDVLQGAALASDALKSALEGENFGVQCALARAAAPVWGGLAGVPQICLALGS